MLLIFSVAYNRGIYIISDSFTSASTAYCLRHTYLSQQMFYSYFEYQRRALFEEQYENHGRARSTLLKMQRTEP
jgi:hypothetical protein